MAGWKSAQWHCPDVDILWAGFSCTSISAMNSSPSDIRETTCPTGATLQGCLAYAAQHKPTAVLYENVERVGQTQTSTQQKAMDHIMQCTNKVGYTRFHKVVDTRNFYFPHRRRRVYMVFILNLPCASVISQS